MQTLKQLNQLLLQLAWSLWTELGVAGVVRNHQNTLILLEELVLFTSALHHVDFRLRDEMMDWCSQYHRFVSVSRLKSVMPDFQEGVADAFDSFASTLNGVAQTKWPLYLSATPFPIALSRKSVLYPHGSPALLSIRTRSIFGVNARADLLTFFLTHVDSDFSIAELTDLGYTKRNLADGLSDLHFANLFDRFMQGNQHRYRLRTMSYLVQMLQPIPSYQPWRTIFKVLLSLRSCMQRIESHAASTQFIEIRGCLSALETPLQKLGLTPPPFLPHFDAYLTAFHHWLLKWVEQLAAGDQLNSQHFE